MYSMLKGILFTIVERNSYCLYYLGSIIAATAAALIIIVT